MTVLGIVFMLAGAAAAVAGLAPDPAAEPFLALGEAHRLVSFHRMFFQTGMILIGTALFVAGAVFVAAGKMTARGAAPPALAIAAAPDDRDKDADTARNFLG